LAECQALELPASIIYFSPDTYRGTNVFIGSDSQSCVTGIAAGPLRRCVAQQMDFSHVWDIYLTLAHQFEMNFTFHYVPAHVGILENEEVDALAYHYSHSFSSELQAGCSVDFLTFRSALHSQLHSHSLTQTEQAFEEKPSDWHTLLGTTHSNL
jgi:hypothetical protein